MLGSIVLCLASPTAGSRACREKMSMVCSSNSNMFFDCGTEFSLAAFRDLDFKNITSRFFLVNTRELLEKENVGLWDLFHVNDNDCEKDSH